MISHTTEKFRKLFAKLPKEIRLKARESYSQFHEDPYYPSLNFKKVHSTKPVYAVRISKEYRALGMPGDGKILWFWIGSHSDYDKILKHLRG